MKRLLFLLSFFLLVPIIQAQDSACSPALSFSYDTNVDIFSLVNANGELIQTYTEIRAYDELEHSPDCRFVVATLWRDHPENHSVHNGLVGDTTVWNASTGAQLQVFEDAHTRPHRIQWSPDSERLIVGTRYAFFLWNFYTDTTTQIAEYGIERWWLEVYWDTSRTEVFILPSTYYYSETDVTVYNWLTGLQLASYGTPPELMHYIYYPETSFAVRENWVIVSMFKGGRTTTPITVWDRNTRQAVYQLNGGTAGVVPSDRNINSQLIDISPDNRYLVVGFMTLRVWDLANLPEAFEERTATFQYPIDNRGVNRVQFIDNTTVEILLDDNTSLIRMNILTGEVLE